MAHIKTFATRKAARVELNKMMGWAAKVSQLFMPEDENANKSGNVFVIAEPQGLGDQIYLREDGYVN